MYTHMIHTHTHYACTQVWNITTGQCLHTLQGSHKHLSAVTSLQFTDHFVVTSSDDGTVKLWDLITGDFIRNLVELPSGGSGEWVKGRHLHML